MAWYPQGLSNPRSAGASASRKALGSLDFRNGLVPEAREKARQLREVAREGGDPLIARRKERGMPTFEEAARKVHEMNRPLAHRQRPRAQLDLSLENHV